MSHASVVAGRPDPASWLDGASVLKIPRKGPGQPAIPLPIGDRLRPVTIEDMRSIPALHRTGGTALPSSLLICPPAGELFDYEAVGLSSLCSCFSDIFSPAHPFAPS